MKALLRISVAVLTVALAACQSQKVPAEAALATAQTAFNAVSAEAQKYVPDEARSIQEALAAAKDTAVKGDYAAALTQAQALPAKISALSSAISAKKAELMTAWTSMSAGVPPLVAAVKTRLEHPPAGLTKAAIADAKTGLASATEVWSEATAAAQSGDVATAMAKGTDVKNKVLGLMQSLHMPAPKQAP